MARASASGVLSIATVKAEAKQAELIGMTSVTESVGVLFTLAETVKASFEAETSGQ